MSIFKKPPMSFPSFEKIKSPIPLEHFDVSKRYDIYYFTRNDERLYQNVRFVATRTLEDISPNFSNLSGFVEIEAIDGTRVMLSRFGIHAICEHGAKPHYKVLKSWKTSDDHANEMESF